MILSNGTNDIFKNHEGLQYLVIAGYSIIFVLGVVGNSFVIFVVMRSRHMRTITNIFISNLALSDIIMCLIAVPFTPIALFMNNWTLPASLCKVLPMTMGVSVYVSTLTSTAIAIDRFFIIVHPFIPRMKNSLCGFIICVIWIIAILISLPLAVYQTKRNDLQSNTSKCQEVWPIDSSREVFTFVSFVLQFVLPCSIISVCYFKISKILRERCKSKVGSGTKSIRGKEGEIKRKRKTNKMLIAMVTIFVICWIPLNSLWMATDMSMNFKYDLRLQFFFPIGFFICHMIAMSSAVYNPFLYAWLNDNFKREFRNLVPCLSCILKPVLPNNPSVTCRPDSRIATTYQMTTCEQEEDSSKKTLLPNSDSHIGLVN
uniref:NPYR-8 n=1 Tax=Schmidtea mediterranea TaxID=79327 RepID=A0A193KUI6_SCHMD|nr:NPYR-8 [Schmidtea mediterranea]